MIALGIVAVLSLGYISGAPDHEDGTLTREVANSLLEQSPLLQAKRPTLSVSSAFIEYGIRKGYLERSATSRSCGHRMVRKKVFFTVAGKKALDDGVFSRSDAPFGEIAYTCEPKPLFHKGPWQTPYFYTAQSRLAAVSGISESDANTYRVEFYCSYVIPDHLIKFIEKNGKSPEPGTDTWACKGIALIKMYDDGWRVTALHMQRWGWQ